MKINFIIIQNFFLVDFFFEKKNYSQHVPRFFKDVLRIILKKIGKSEDFCLFLICFFSDPFPDRFFFFLRMSFFFHILGVKIFAFSWYGFWNTFPDMFFAEKIFLIFLIFLIFFINYIKNYNITKYNIILLKKLLISLYNYIWFFYLCIYLF